HELSCCPRQQDQQSRGERVESSRMAGASVRPRPYLPHHGERGRAGRLVDEDHARRLEPTRRHLGPPARPPYAAARPAAANSRRTNSVISSTEASLEKPAACRCPPPPERRAIADTSSSSTLERRLTRRVGPSPSRRGGSR